MLVVAYDTTHPCFEDLVILVGIFVVVGVLSQKDIRDQESSPLHNVSVTSGHVIMWGIMSVWNFSPITSVLTVSHELSRCNV